MPRVCVCVRGGGGKGLEWGKERKGQAGEGWQASGEGSLAGTGRGEGGEEGFVENLGALHRKFGLKHLEVCCKILSSRDLQSGKCFNGPTCWRRAGQGETGEDPVGVVPPGSSPSCWVQRAPTRASLQ